MVKSNLKKNDNVMVISGADRGKRGKILYVDRKLGKVVVEGINKKKKFVRPSQENPKGGTITLEYPIHLSNAMIFCDKCKKAVRIGSKQKDGNKIRVCTKCGKSFD